MKLRRNETKCLQGIAILFMLGLHLFNRSDISNYYNVKIYLGGVPLLTHISYIFDACVPIYLFCSGYGLYISEDSGSNMKKRMYRVLRLLIRFWIIMVLTCCVGFTLGMRDRFPGSVLNFILNACLVKSSYVGAFWFVQTYTILALLSGVIFKLIKKHSYWVVLLVSFVLYVAAFGIEYVVLGKIEIEAVRLFVNALMLLLRSQFSFVIGMILAKENMLDRSKLLSKIRNNPVLPWIFLIIVIVVRAILRHMIFAPFSAVALIILFGTYNWGKLGEKILLFFGKHSTNMWLTHMQFYMIFTPTLVFCWRNVFVIMLTLVALSLAASYVVDWVYGGVMRLVEKKGLKRRYNHSL